MDKISDEELIKQLKDRLDEHTKTISELQEVSNELKESNAKLEESEALKSHFISNITNELINPFASIMALSREILELKGKPDWEKVEMMVNLIHTETFHLDFQLRNIFAAARLEAGEASPEINKVNIHSLIENTLDLFILEAKKNKITLHSKIDNVDDGKDLEFNTDPTKLRLILMNFLSNALKFSKSNTTVNVLVALLENRHLQLTIKDEGYGIPEDFRNAIYDRFTKNDDTINSVTRGNGLGLSINKAFIEILGGTVEFESEVGKGTTFTVTIPESSGDVNAYSDGGNEFFFGDELVI